MTKGIGIDIVDVERMAKRIEKLEFMNLVSTKLEMGYCRTKKHQAQHFAARFAAKEAYMKALGLGWTSDARHCTSQSMYYLMAIPYWLFAIDWTSQGLHA